MTWWLAGWAGCDGGGEVAPVETPCAEVGWEVFTEPVLTTWCTPCHAATVVGEDRRGAPDDVDFDTYESAARWADRIVARTGPDGAMPPAGGLTEAEAAGLERWVSCGSAGPPTPADPCAERIEYTGAATAAGEPCAAGATVVTGDLVVAADPGSALDCVCEVAGELRISASVTLPNLERAGTVTVNAGAAEVALPALITAGELVVEQAELARLDLDALESVDANLVVFGGSLPAAFGPPRLGAVGANLLVREVAGIEQIELPRLESVGLDFAVVGLPDLVRLFHTSDLESVGRDLRIVDSPSLAAIEDFSFVGDVGGDVELAGDGLVSVVAFFALERIDGDLVVRDAPRLATLAAFPDLEVVKGEVHLSDVGLADVGGFDRLRQVGGIVVSDAPDLAAWSAGSVDEVLGDVVISRSDNLPRVPFLDGVQRVDGSLVLTRLQRLNSTSALAGVTSLGGDLELSEVGLSSLGLEGLTAVSGSVRIAGNLALGDVGLPNLAAIDGDLAVTDNPELSQVAVDGWIAGIEVGGSTTASGNGP
ncbi:MAG: hypothetical protein ABMA64_14570 [Myxococcota bacterium]